MKLFFVLRHARFAGLATTRDGKGWEIQAARGMDDHELARLNWRNELDPDRVLWEIARTSFGTTRRP